MKKYKLCFLFCIFLSFLPAQNQTNFWYFGTLCGLDFTSGSPVAIINPPLNTAEGSAAISDAAGNLLFFTDGMQVWDKNSVQMPNGFGLFGDPSTTQSALIVPDPGNANLYYIFTIDDEGQGAGLCYSVVDMTLQSGNGDVTIKNFSLRTTVTEKLCAVYHCNNTDVWVTVHDWLANTFVSYLVSASGVSAPVISAVGTSHNVVHGQMKFNSTGSKIACAIGYQDIVEYLDFDNTTGIVSNPLTLNVNHHAYGLEFSPDNSKLYVTYYDVGAWSWLGQFDLTAGNVQSSLVQLYSDPNPILYALQLGPDDKVYVTKEISPYVSVVNLPNVAGAGCNYVDNVINLDPNFMGSMCMLGLPGFIQSYFHPSFPTVPCSVISANFQSSDTTICTNTCINFTDLSSGAVTSWNWNFTGATPNTSTSQNPGSVCYAGPGTYPVSLVISNGTNSDTITSVITVASCNTINANFQSSDTTVCVNSCVNFNDLSSGTVNSWTWTFTGASPANSSAQNPTGICYAVPGTYQVMLIASDGFVSDTITSFITVTFPTVYAGADTTIISGSSAQLNASGSINYSWSPGTGLSDSTIANPVASPTATTTYYLTGTDANGCTATDSITVTVDIVCGEVFVPTAFSPNEDLKNDVLCVYGNCITFFQLQIFDRWGERVFLGQDQKDCWDGTYQGKKLAPGVYAYFLNATLVNGKDVMFKGNITLVR